MARTISPTRLVTLLGDAPHRRPAYRSVSDALRLLIDDGRIPSGTRLPSERSVAEVIGCSRTTITRAYALLAEAGFAVPRRGSGTVTLLPDAAVRDGRAALVPDAATAPTDESAPIDLTCAAFPPPPQLHQAYESALSSWPEYLRGSGYYPLGVPALREAVAERFSRRGLPTSAEDVLITSGAVGAHAIVARALLASGSRLLVDSPTYPNGVEALRAAGARPVAIPLDAEGWDLSSWRAAARGTGAVAALLVPDFQNPTGLLMSDEERARLARVLGHDDLLAVVDETLVDSSLTGAPMPAPFAAHHPRTVTIGGASKSHWSGLRVGWVRAPADLLASLAAARTTLDLGSPVLEQLALLELMQEDEAIAGAHREAATERRDVLVDELSRQLPDWRFRRPDGGLCLWVTLPEPASTPFVIAAEDRGVVLAPGPKFAPEPGLERHLRVPFTLPAPTLREAVARMSAVWETLDRTRAPSREVSSPLIA